MGSYPTYKGLILFFLIYNNSYKIIFILILIISTIFIISSNSWITIWIGLEINLLSFIPLIRDNKLISSEASLKYFLIQTFASSIMLLAIILIINQLNLINLLIFSSLLLKIGASPFHFWLPIVNEGLSWTNSIILISWQKIAPIIIISHLSYNFIINLSIILSSIIGAIGGLNQTSLRKLLAYSSINHIRWILIRIIIRFTIWILYFIIYSLILLSIVIYLNSLKISHINQLFSSFSHNKLIKILFIINLLSIGGLPPFSGFFPKWILINFIINNNQLFILFILIIFSLITLFYYLRLTYSSFILNYLENNWNNSIKINLIFNISITTITLFNLILMPLYFIL